MGLMGEVSKFFLVGMILVCVTLLFDVIGLATPYWAYYSKDSVTVHWGLWRSCTKTSVSDTCINLVDADSADWMKATQALSIIGFLFLVPAVVVVIIKLAVKRDSKLLVIIGTALVFTGVFFALVTAIVFADKTELEPVATIKASLHVSFAFTILAFILGVVGGIFLVLDIVMGNY